MTADKTPAAADKPAAPAPTAMTAAAAAKLVKRTVTAVVDGEAITTQVPVKAAEVLAFKDYGTHVVVVTTDGQKFSSADVAA